MKIWYTPKLWRVLTREMTNWHWVQTSKKREFQFDVPQPTGACFYNEFLLTTVISNWRITIEMPMSICDRFLRLSISDIRHFPVRGADILLFSKSIQVGCDWISREKPQNRVVYSILVARFFRLFLERLKGWRILPEWSIHDTDKKEYVNSNPRGCSITESVTIWFGRVKSLRSQDSWKDWVCGLILMTVANFYFFYD